MQLAQAESTIGPARSRLRIGRVRAEHAVLIVLAVWALLPIASLVARAVVHGGVYTGVTGLDPDDQFQYLAWIRDTGSHGLASNLFGMSGGGHVFAQPMYLVSGLLWRLGVGLQLSYLLWAPVAVLALWFGFSRFAAATGETPARRLAILVVGLFFAAPLGWLSLSSTPWSLRMQLALSETVTAIQPWIALHTAIALGLMPLAVLGSARIASARELPATRSPLVIGTAAAAALVSWLHSWQGATLLLIMLGLGVAKRSRRHALILAIPTIACSLPLVYQYALTRFDRAWQIADAMNHRPDLIVPTPTLAVLGPLVAAATIGVIRRPPRSPLDLAVVLWPLAALAVYVLDREFPPHALQGVALPLAVLAARGWPHGRAAAVAGGLAVLAFTLPGLAYFAKNEPQAVRAKRGLYLLAPEQHAAFDYLAQRADGGGVLAPFPLALAVPAFTGHPVWDGHQVWTPDRHRPLEANLFFAGAMTANQSESFVRHTRVHWLLADCHTTSDTLARVAVLTAEVRHFGCVTLMRML